MNTEQLRARLYEKLARIAHVLGAPARLRILQILAQAPRSVEEISQLSGESVANTSQHLQKMAREGLVFVTRKGLTRIYSVSSPEVVAIWESLQDLGHVLAPELNALEDRLIAPELKAPIAAERVLSEVRSKKAILLDVRETKETEATPVEGAISIPLQELKSQTRGMDKNRVVYVFCRGKYCGLASEAVEYLRGAGFQAYRLRESAFRLQHLNRKK